MLATGLDDAKLLQKLTSYAETNPRSEIGSRVQYLFREWKEKSERVDSRLSKFKAVVSPVESGRRMIAKDFLGSDFIIEAKMLGRKLDRELDEQEKTAGNRKSLL